MVPDEQGVTRQAAPVESRTDGPAGRPLARYLAAAVPARTADEGARVALVLLAVERSGSAAFGGLLIAALMVPHVVAAPPAGALADTVRHRRAFHGGLLALYGGALVTVAAMTGRAPDPLVLAVAVAAGCCAPLVTGGLTGLLGELVPPERRTRAFSFDSVSYNLAGICGPSLAAALSGLAGPGAALALLGAGAALGGAVVATLPLRTRPHLPGHRRLPRASDLAAGAAVLVRDPALRSVTWAGAAGQVGIGALPVVAVLFATRHHTAWATGGLMTAFALGALAGSLAYGRRPLGADRPERVVLLGLFGTGVPLACLPAVSGVWSAAALFAVAGSCTGPLFSALLAARELHAPAAARSQVFTLGAGLKSAAAAAGAAGAGLLTAWSTSALFLAAALCQFLAAALGALLLRSAV